MKLLSTFYLIISLTASGAGILEQARSLPKPLAGVHRIVFLGDSITWAGGYIEEIELTIATQFPDSKTEILNLGLPSETVSGLTEPNHAGGAFPRPDLHERLDRVLAKTKPDLVVACYGMNDGIYYPLSEERFRAYREGILKLRDKVFAAGAKLWLLTPPTFDALPIKSSTLPAGREVYPSGQPYVGYDDVLAEYSRWIASKRKDGWDVVDVHKALRSHLDDMRKANPAYSFASDGVHPNDEGQHLIAKELLHAWRLPADASEKASPELRNLIHERHTLLRDAWLTEVGHKRPGMPQGQSVADATRKASEIQDRIRAIMRQ